MYFIAASIGDCPHARSRCGPISKNEPRRSAKHPGRGGHEAQGRAESDARADPRIRPGRRREVFRPSRTGRRRGGRPCGAFPFAPEPAVPPRPGPVDRARAADSGAASRTNLTRKAVGRRIRARRQMSICSEARRQAARHFRDVRTVPPASDAGRGALKTGLQGGAPASTPSSGRFMWQRKIMKSARGKRIRAWAGTRF